MRRIFCLLCCISMFGLVTAQETEGQSAQDAARSPQALEILEKVDAAIKAVSSVRYDAVVEASGSALRFTQPATGTQVQVGWNGRGAERFLTTVKTTDPDAEKSAELTAGGNGEMFFIIDHGTKKAYEDIDPNVLGSSARAIQRFGMIEYIADKPFDDELGAEGLELVGEETVGGEACYKIHVKYAEGQGESTWFFSKKDLLPRRRIQAIDMPGLGEGTIETSISRLEVNVEPDEDLFLLKLPEGYEQIDDFAP